MKAERLPSGSYRYLVRYYDSDRKRHLKSFTDIDRETAKQKALEFKRQHQTAPRSSGSFGVLMDKYISTRVPHLSPATIRGYRNMEKRLQEDYPFFCQMPVAVMQKSDVQDVLNGLTRDGSKPKTIRNFSGLISGVLRENDISIGKVVLPQKTARNITVPEKDDVMELIKAAHGTDLEIPIMLAAFCGLRRGEVCALRMSDIEGNVIHVCRDMVPGPTGEWHIKPPKTRASDRYIECSDKVIARVHEVGKITDMNPRALSCRFRRFVRKTLPKEKVFRFHDLRHFCVSYMHSQGIPDTYIQKRCGFENDITLKAVYRHVLQDQEKRFIAKVNESFDSFFS